VSDGANSVARARRAVEARWAHDAAARELGMALETVEPDTATVSMLVGADLVNGHDICHGGFILTLAETALMLACHTDAREHDVQGTQITFIAPGRRGMRLLAQAHARHRGERNAIWDVSVRTETGEAIAEVRGHTRRTG